MKCPYCKKEIEVNMTFCPHCMSVLKDADVEEFLKVEETDAKNDPKDISIKEFIADVLDETDDTEDNTEESNEESVEESEIIEPTIAIVHTTDEQEENDGNTELPENNKEQNINTPYQQTYKQQQSPIWAALWAILSVLVIGVFVFGYFIYQKYTAPVEYFGLLRPHPDVEAEELDMTTKNAATKVIEGEFSLNQYLKEAHIQDNKNKLFKMFYENIIYYTDVMSTKFNEEMLEKCNEFKIEEQPGIQTYKCEGITINFNVKVEYDTDYQGNPYHYALINDVKIVSPETNTINVVGNGEGGYEFLPNFSYLDEYYARYLTPDWQDFLALKANEQDDLNNQPLFADGYLTVDLKKISDWIISLNDFKKKYPKFELSDEITKTIHSYTSILLLTEYRTFDPATNKLLVKAKLAYEYFLNKSDPKTEEYLAVKECYDALKANNYKYNSDFREAFEKWNKKWAEEEKTD